MKCFDSIVLHNALFPETSYRVMGFTRDRDGLFRTVIEQRYVEEDYRDADIGDVTKWVEGLGFEDNNNHEGLNYKSSKLKLEDLHGENVIYDKSSGKLVCLDCIVKFNTPEQGGEYTIPESEWGNALIQDFF